MAGMTVSHLMVNSEPGIGMGRRRPFASDRKSTRLNSSHLVISYAVFCLKKKKHIHAPRSTPKDSIDVRTSSNASRFLRISAHIHAFSWRLPRAHPRLTCAHSSE